jgi:Rad3-related DNA helicase
MNGAFSIAVDQRADTRYQQRRKNLPLTAKTIADFKHDHHLPVVVFTPSFDYAAQIEEQLAFHHPYLRSIRQPSDLPQSEQATWIEEQLPFVDIMLLIMGSRFAEGIDMLGGRIERAIVVGPALPSPDPILEAKTRNHPLPREQAFEQLYQIPGMIRVSQSIGRLVRAPGQQVSIILHCQRFAEPAYQNLLPPQCQGGTLITSDRDLENWIANHREADQ